MKPIPNKPMLVITKGTAKRDGQAARVRVRPDSAPLQLDNQLKKAERLTFRQHALRSRNECQLGYRHLCREVPNAAIVVRRFKAPLAVPGLQQVNLVDGIGVAF